MSEFTFSAGTLPLGAIYTPQSYFNAIAANLVGTVNAGAAPIQGQVGGSMPVTNIGPWLNLNPLGWWFWDAGTAQYLPDQSQLSIGHIIASGCTTFDATHFLACDGRAVPRATYNYLFTSIGTNYGVGDSSTTFNLPNLTGRTIIGQGINSVAIISVSAASPAVITTASDHGFLDGDNVSVAGVIGASPSVNNTYAVTVLSTTSFSVPVNTTVAGTGGTASKSITNYVNGATGGAEDVMLTAAMSFNHAHGGVPTIGTIDTNGTTPGGGTDVRGQTGSGNTGIWPNQTQFPVPTLPPFGVAQWLIRFI